MFFNEKGAAFRILGIFRVLRKKGSATTKERGFATLSYRIRGNCRFAAGGESFSATSGSTLYLPDQTSFVRESLNQGEIVVIHLQCLGDSPRDFWVENKTEELESLFLQMLSLWEEDAPGAYNRCMALLYTVFQRLEKLREQAGAPIPAAIAPGVELIRSHFRDPGLTVAQAAKASFVSEVYFRKLYRKAFGLSPLQWILEKRFENAAQLLRSGYYTTEEAARLSGFSDIKHFRTAFTRRFGVSPAAYRRKG